MQGNFIVPVTCGPVTYSSSFPSTLKLDDPAKGYLAANLYGSVDFSSVDGPAISLFGSAATVASWGYQPNNYCVSGAGTSAGSGTTITLTLPAAAADGTACAKYPTAGLRWTGASVDAPTYYFTYTCASRVSATPSSSVSVLPLNRMRRA